MPLPPSASGRSRNQHPKCMQVSRRARHGSNKKETFQVVTCQNRLLAAMRDMRRKEDLASTMAHLLALTLPPVAVGAPTPNTRGARPLGSGGPSLDERRAVSPDRGGNDSCATLCLRMCVRPESMPKGIRGDALAPSASRRVPNASLGNGHVPRWGTLHKIRRSTDYI